MGRDLKGKELGKGISQRKDGRYCGRFTNRFGKRQSLYSFKLTELRAAMNMAIYEDKKHISLYSEKITLDEWYETWLRLYKNNTVRSTTLANYKASYERYIRPELGSMRLASIKADQVQKLLNKLRESGLRYKTVLQVRIILVDMFGKAITSEYLSKNPAKGATVPKGSQKERRVLTVEEQTKFLQAAAGAWYEPLFYVALLTGLRQGELCALTWDDVDFDAKALTVSKTLVLTKEPGEQKASFKVHPPKTIKGRRVIPLTDEAIHALRKQQKQCQWLLSREDICPQKGFENQVFYTKTGSPVCDRTIVASIKAVRRRINSTRGEGEPEFEHFSPHTFRHTFATRCFENGMQPKTLQELLGHSSLQMTMDLYTHVTQDMKKKEAERITLIGINPTGVKLV